MSDGRRDRIVAIAAKDPNLGKSLLRLVAVLHSGDATYLLQTSDDWTLLPRKGLWWIFIDCSVVDSFIAKTLWNFEQVVFFNYKGNERRVQDFFEPVAGQSGPTIVKHDYLLTESLLEAEYGKQIGSRQLETLENGGVVRRVRSVAEGQHQAIYTGPVLRAEAIQDLLSLLQSGLTGEDYDTLYRGFVTDTSRMQIPASQRMTKNPLSDLREAADVLAAFAADPHSSGKGSLLIGKKGAGKSTLAYYVGRTLDHQRKVFCVAVDYTLESDFALQGRLHPLLSSFREHCPKAGQLHMTGYPQTIVFRAREYLRGLIASEQYDEIQGVSDEAQTILMLESDRGFITHMFCYYTMSGVQPEEILLQYDWYTTLIAKAESWYTELRYDPSKLFVYYLNFLLDAKCREALDSYTYRAMLRYLLSIDEHATDTVSAIRRASENLGLSSLFEGCAGDLSPKQAISACHDMPLTQLRKLTCHVMENLSGGRPILVLLDNLDQRTSIVVEAHAIFDAVKLFLDQIVDTFPSARAIVAARDTTIDSQEWANIEVDVIKGWKQVYMLPPDLVSVLKRRCLEWQQRCNKLAAQGYRRSMGIVSWIGELPDVQKDEDDQRLGLVEIIQHRHPFNVREQLIAFSKCCENVILHREWESSQPGKSTWRDKSYEFFLRVFLLGESRFFSEEHCKLPNMYDNGFPGSPFNACIRSWLLFRLETGRQFEQKTIVEEFAATGIPVPEVHAAMVVLERYRLILPRAEKGIGQLSIWGAYFRDRIGYDLPYISTIWWTTSMLEGYSLGEARELRPSELREYSGKFLRWLDHEEDLAHASASVDELNVVDVFEKASANVGWSLNRIEKAIQSPTQR